LPPAGDEVIYEGLSPQCWHCHGATRTTGR